MDVIDLKSPFGTDKNKTYVFNKMNACEFSFFLMRMAEILGEGFDGDHFVKDILSSSSEEVVKYLEHLGLPTDPTKQLSIMSILYFIKNGLKIYNKITYARVKPFIDELLNKVQIRPEFNREAVPFNVNVHVGDPRTVFWLIWQSFKVNSDFFTVAESLSSLVSQASAPTQPEYQSKQPVL